MRSRATLRIMVVVAFASGIFTALCVGASQQIARQARVRWRASCVGEVGVSESHLYCLAPHGALTVIDLRDGRRQQHHGDALVRALDASVVGWMDERWYVRAPRGDGRHAISRLAAHAECGQPPSSWYDDGECIIEVSCDAIQSTCGERSGAVHLGMSTGLGWAAPLGHGRVLAATDDGLYDVVPLEGQMEPRGSDRVDLHLSGVPGIIVGLPTLTAERRSVRAFDRSGTRWTLPGKFIDGFMPARFRAGYGAFTEHDDTTERPLLVDPRTGRRLRIDTPAWIVAAAPGCQVWQGEDDWVFVASTRAHARARPLMRPAPFVSAEAAWVRSVSWLEAAPGAALVFLGDTVVAFDAPECTRRDPAASGPNVPPPSLRPR